MFIASVSLKVPPFFDPKISSDLHRSQRVPIWRLGGMLPRLPPPPRGDATAGMVLSDAGGALRVTVVGPSKVTSGWPLDAQVLVGSSEPPI